MALVAQGASIAGAHGPLLLPTDLIAEAGRVTTIAGTPGPPSNALALALGGRIRLTSGTVSWQHSTDPARMRRHVALVDVPGVTEPDGGLPVKTVIGQELALAGQPPHRDDVHAFLSDRDHEDAMAQRWDALEPRLRTRWLTELAFMEADVSAVVLSHQDRWGGDPHEWYADLTEQLRDERVIVAICAPATRAILGIDDAFEIGVTSH